MSNVPRYLFNFDYFLFDVPYTNLTIQWTKPWTYILSIGSCFLYLWLITSIFPKYKSKFNHTFAITQYGLLFLYSLVSCGAILFYIIETKEITNWSELLCTPVPSWIRLVSISFTISKIWEWFDTAVLISKGQSLSKIGFLHIFHHATTFLLFLCIPNFPGADKAAILFNGFVHTLMYYHFAFRLPKIFRPIITTCQIIQLLSSMYVWYLIPQICEQYKEFPRKHLFEYLLPYTLVPVYALFFLKFFIQQYLFSSSKKSFSRKIQ